MVIVYDCVWYLCIECVTGHMRYFYVICYTWSIVICNRKYDYCFSSVVSICVYRYCLVLIYSYECYLIWIW